MKNRIEILSDSPELVEREFQEVSVIISEIEKRLDVLS